MLLKRGVDLGARHGNGGWLLPIPATFVIDPTGKITYAYVNPDYTYRPDPAELVSALKQPRRS
jgi:peroxiredoxin